MFQHLISLSNTKNWKEAIGFFVFHVAIVYGILIIVGIVMSFAVLSGTIGLQGQGKIVGGGLASLVWIIYSLVLNSILLVKKNLYKNFWYAILAIFSLAVNGAGIAVAAFLTTRNSEFVTSSNEAHPIVLK